MVSGAVSSSTPFSGESITQSPAVRSAVLAAQSDAMSVLAPDSTTLWKAGANLISCWGSAEVRSRSGWWGEGRERRLG